MDEIVDRLADEGVAVKLLAEHYIAINADAAARSDAIQCAGVVETFEGLASGVQEISVRAGGDGYAWTRGNDVRIAAKIIVRDGIMPRRNAVIAAEPVA